MPVLSSVCDFCCNDTRPRMWLSDHGVRLFYTGGLWASVDPALLRRTRPVASRLQERYCKCNSLSIFPENTTISSWMPTESFFICFFVLLSSLFCVWEAFEAFLFRQNQAQTETTNNQISSSGSSQARRINQSKNKAIKTPTVCQHTWCQSWRVIRHELFLWSSIKQTCLEIWIYRFALFVETETYNKR